MVFCRAGNQLDNRTGSTRCNKELKQIADLSNSHNCHLDTRPLCLDHSFYALKEVRDVLKVAMLQARTAC